MTQTPANPKTDFSRIELKAARQIFDRFPFPDDIRALLTGQPTALEFFNSLVAQKKHQPAVTFLAFALPKKEAVLWAALCAKLAGGPNGAPLPPKQAAALQAAQRWVQNPTDENRRAAYPAAEAATFGTPAGCAALAAFLSGGSLAPPDLTAIPPPEYACGQTAGHAVIVAGVISSPEKALEKYARFLAEGFAIAGGRPPSDKPL